MIRWHMFAAVSICSLWFKMLKDDLPKFSETVSIITPLQIAAQT